MNWRLASVFFSIVSTVTTGVLMVIALLLGYDDATGIIVAVVVGLLIALPITYGVTKAILALAERERQLR